MTAFLLSLIATNPILDLDVWLNKESGLYYPGENLTVFFKTNRACFIAIYNIETGGRVNRLFPRDGQAGWVENDLVYQLPAEDANYDYVVADVEGIERIIARASKDRLPSLEDEGEDIITKTIEVHIQEPDPAQLRLVAAPEHCRIYIRTIATDHEEYYGTTPKTIELSPGEYDVTIKKNGFRTLTRRIDLVSGERRRVRVSLNPYWY